MDEYGNDFNWTPEPRKMVTAVLPHPMHGRLVERPIMMVSQRICFRGCWYSLSWLDQDIAFYQPATYQPW